MTTVEPALPQQDPATGGTAAASGESNPSKQQSAAAAAEADGDAGAGQEAVAQSSVPEPVPMVPTSGVATAKADAATNETARSVGEAASTSASPHETTPRTPIVSPTTRLQQEEGHEQDNLSPGTRVLVERLAQDAVVEDAAADGEKAGDAADGGGVPPLSANVGNVQPHLQLVYSSGQVVPVGHTMQYLQGQSVQQVAAGQQAQAPFQLQQGTMAHAGGQQASQQVVYYVPSGASAPQAGAAPPVMYYLQGHQTQYMHHSAMGPPPQPVQRKASAPANDAPSSQGTPVGAAGLAGGEGEQPPSDSPSNAGGGAEEGGQQRGGAGQGGVQGGAGAAGKGREAQGRGQEGGGSQTTYVPYIPGQPLPQQVLVGPDGKSFGAPTVQVGGQAMQQVYVQQPGGGFVVYGQPPPFILGGQVVGAASMQQYAMAMGQVETLARGRGGTAVRRGVSRPGAAARGRGAGRGGRERRGGGAGGHSYTRVFDQNGREVSGESAAAEEAEVKAAAALLKTVTAQAKEAVEQGEGREEEAEEEVLYECVVQDEVALALLRKSMVKARWGRQSRGTRFLGVRRLYSGRFKSCIWNGKGAGRGRRRCLLGVFDSAVEAAKAYDRAARALKGSAAITNFPPNDPEEAGTDPEALLQALEAEAETDSEGVDDGELEGGERERRGTPPRWSRRKRQDGAGSEGGAREEEGQAMLARYIGVWRKAGGPWKASLWKGENGQKRTMHLGTFRSPMAAALAYDRAAVAARGRLAKTNFPISEELLASSKTRAVDQERTADALAQAWASAQEDRGCQMGVLQGKYIGVECTVAGRWQSYLYVREDRDGANKGVKRKMVLGVYNQAVQAARAYDHVVVALFGKDAPTNFPVARREEEEAAAEEEKDDGDGEGDGEKAEEAEVMEVEGGKKEEEQAGDGAENGDSEQKDVEMGEARQNGVDTAREGDETGAAMEGEQDVKEEEEGGDDGDGHGAEDGKAHEGDAHAENGKERAASDGDDGAEEEEEEDGERRVAGHVQDDGGSETGGERPPECAEEEEEARRRGSDAAAVEEEGGEREDEGEEESEIRDDARKGNLGKTPDEDGHDDGEEGAGEPGDHGVNGAGSEAAGEGGEGGDAGDAGGGEERADGDGDGGAELQMEVEVADQLGVEEMEEG